jgi:CRISPR system Cascade subunit CasA
MFNLITEKWLPVVRASGMKETIRPAEIVSSFNDDPVVAFAWGRADYDAASREFIIGLLATACPPVDGKSWRASWTNPPRVEELDASFSPFIPAFNMDGKGPLFMQDEDELLEQTEKAVSTLPIESAGAITLADNADLFQKRDDFRILSRAGAAIVLFTVQLYAGFGGTGHRVALRGRGPVTTLVCARGEASLWRLLWLNTPQQLDTADCSSKVFPWMGATRTSNKKEETTPLHVSPLTQFWGMPSRVRLVMVENNDHARCPLTGEVDDVIVTGFRVLNYGSYYGANWKHILTPHYLSNKNDWLPVHGQTGGVPYTDWPDYAGAPTQTHRPAEIVAIAEKRLLALGVSGEMSLSAFALNMSNTKVVSADETSVPLFNLPEPYAQTFYGAVERLVDGAGIVSSFTRSAVRDATIGKSGDVNKGCVRKRFNDETEVEFYDTLRHLASALAEAEGDPAPIILEHAQKWLCVLRREALSLFDECAPISQTRGSATERTAKARLYLALALNGLGGGGRKVFDSLGLPQVEKSERKKAA